VNKIKKTIEIEGWTVEVKTTQLKHVDESISKGLFISVSNENENRYIHNLNVWQKSESEAREK
jgi:hypothetical protein